MQLEPTLRPAIVSDVEAISSLIGRVWSKNFAYSVTPDDLVDFLQTKLHPESIAKEIADTENVRFITALNDLKEVIGVVQLVRRTTKPFLTSPRPVEIKRLYVDDTYHGKGLAKGLVGAAEDWASEEGYGGVWLGVWEGNERAIAFYKKMGLETKGELFFYVGQSERRDWVMEKILTKRGDM